MVQGNASIYDVPLTTQMAGPSRYGGPQAWLNNGGVMADNSHSVVANSFSKLWNGQPLSRHNNPYSALFGIARPDAQINVDPDKSFSEEIRDLPDAYEGKNVLLGRILISQMTASRSFAIDEICPFERSDGLRTEIHGWVFKDEYLGQVPEQGVPRLVRNNQTTISATLTRKGLAFTNEHGFLFTPMGEQCFWMQMEQINNATIDTLAHEVITKLYNSEPQTDFKAGRGLTPSKFAKIVDRNCNTWGIINKYGGEGFQTVVALAKETMKKRVGVPGNMAIVPAGAEFAVWQANLLNMGILHQESVKTGKAFWAGSSEKIVLRESRSFQTYADYEDDPAYRLRTIGGYNIMNMTQIKDVEPSKFHLGTMMSLEVWDEKLGFQILSPRDLYKFTGAFPGWDAVPPERGGKQGSGPDYVNPYRGTNPLDESDQPFDGTGYSQYNDSHIDTQSRLLNLLRDVRNGDDDDDKDDGLPRVRRGGYGRDDDDDDDEDDKRDDDFVSYFGKPSQRAGQRYAPWALQWFAEKGWKSHGDAYNKQGLLRLLAECIDQKLKDNEYKYLFSNILYPSGIPTELQPRRRGNNNNNDPPAPPPSRRISTVPPRRSTRPSSGSYADISTKIKSQATIDKIVNDLEKHYLDHAVFPPKDKLREYAKTFLIAADDLLRKAYPSLPDTVKETAELLTSNQEQDPEKSVTSYLFHIEQLLTPNYGANERKDGANERKDDKFSINPDEYLFFGRDNSDPSDTIELSQIHKLAHSGKFFILSLSNIQFQLIVGNKEAFSKDPQVRAILDISALYYAISTQQENDATKELIKRIKKDHNYEVLLREENWLVYQLLFRRPLVAIIKAALTGDAQNAPLAALFQALSKEKKERDLIDVHTHVSDVAASRSSSSSEPLSDSFASLQQELSATQRKQIDGVIQTINKTFKPSYAKHPSALPLTEQYASLMSAMLVLATKRSDWFKRYVDPNALPLPFLTNLFTLLERTYLKHIERPQDPDNKHIKSSIRTLLYHILAHLIDNSQPKHSSSDLINLVKTNPDEGDATNILRDWNKIMQAKITIFKTPEPGKEIWYETDAKSVIPVGESIVHPLQTVLKDGSRLPIDRLMQVLIDETEFTKGYRFFKWVVDNNLPVCFGILSFRPNQIWEMGSLCLTFGGGEVGKMLYMMPDFQIANDSVRKIMIANFTVYAGALITDPRKIVIIPDVFCRGYEGGWGTTSWDASNEDHWARQARDPTERDYYHCLVEATFKPIDKYIFLNGKGADQIASNNRPQELSYSTAKYYETIWSNWDSNNGHLISQINPGQPNTMCFQDYQASYNPRNPSRALVVHNQGPWQERIYEGSQQCRAGNGKALMPVDTQRISLVSIAAG